MVWLRPRSHRRTAPHGPVWWNAQEPGAGGFTDSGFWVISRHADIKTISRDNDNWSANENGFFVMLLGVAGNETTRNAIAHGMNAFLDHPDQWELFKRERPTTAADEIVHWATPVTCFQRTARNDVELGGATIRKGQRAGLFYASGNYDDDVFDAPNTFDILRTPNPHLGFGGNGTHHCIGANLARMEIALMFDAMADVIPDVSKVSDPTRVHSPWLNGLKTFAVEYR